MSERPVRLDDDDDVRKARLLTKVNETAAPAAPTVSDVPAGSPPRAELAEEITVGLAGSLNLRRTAMRLISMITTELADWAMLILPADIPGALALIGGDATDFSTVIGRTAVADTGLGGILRTGATELLHVALDSSGDGLASMIPDETLRAEAAGLRPADVLGLGLTARGTTIGALVIIRGQGRGFDDDEVAFAERIATRAAIALDSARLYEERGRIAAALAQNLRPPTLPEVDGIQLAASHRPAAEHLDIGGDFYDVAGSGDDWIVALGDVSGKGIEVAELTGRTRQSIRTAAHFDKNPAAVLGALNSVLYETGSDRFVTVVCARLRPAADGDRAAVDLAVAGQQPPIVLRANGIVEQVDATGPAVSMIREVQYRTTTVELRRGDTMLMFTDGIDEARGRDGFDAVDRLIALLPAYAGAAPDVVCDAVEQDVVEFLDGLPHDDMALLAVTCGN